MSFEVSVFLGFGAVSLGT